jgi:uncharacterized protein (UPF0332 family)
VNPPTKTDNFLHVATALLDEVEGTEAEVAEWNGCENARFRAAVSRAYYAVFLEVKYRVIDLRPEWRHSPAKFPKVKIHGIVEKALQAVNRGQLLSRNYRQLSDSRKDADYNWSSAYRRERAEVELNVARTLLADLSRLTERDWQAIADRLHSLEG